MTDAIREDILNRWHGGESAAFIAASVFRGKGTVKAVVERARYRGDHRAALRTPDKVWTAPRTDKLRVLVADGGSASQISRDLSVGIRITRNAVISKINRLGLQLRLKPGFPQQHKSDKPKPKKEKVLSAAKIIRAKEDRSPRAEPIVDPTDQPGSNAVTFLNLRSDQSQCRWMYGDPKDPGYLYCGEATVGGSSWCCRHLRCVADFSRPVPFNPKAARPRPQLTVAASADFGGMGGD